MTEPVTTLRNIGPAMAGAFAGAGLYTADEIRGLGADAAYSRLVASGTRPHFIAFYALVLGLQGRPWTDISPEEKLSLRARFDSIVAASPLTLEDPIERALDEIGMRAPR